MSEICDKCGLPKEICACGEISKQQARVVIRSEKRRYGKDMTLVEGLDSDQKEIMKKLKSKLACGGTVKDGIIELQGAHVPRAKMILVSLGFPEETIEASK
jgi:translation initiation factor 1